MVFFFSTYFTITNPLYCLAWGKMNFLKKLIYVTFVNDRLLLRIGYMSELKKETYTPETNTKLYKFVSKWT